MRKAGDMFKKVARGDFRNMPYLSKHFLEAERLREKGADSPWCWGGHGGSSQGQTLAQGPTGRKEGLETALGKQLALGFPAARRGRLACWPKSRKGERPQIWVLGVV